MTMAFDIPLILTAAVVLSGLIALLDLVVCARRRAPTQPRPWYLEYARSFFPMLLIVWLLRSFMVQPYRVPTGSLEPTVMPGDFILVSQFSYGLRLPVFNLKLWDLGQPQRGDIALFRYPLNPKIIYVKRVIGLPGDHVVYKNKQLIINGEPVVQHSLGMDLDLESGFAVPVEVRQELLGKVNHKIFIKPGRLEAEEVDLYVPANSYFMMGDNRDSSGDSRMWGFVPEANLVGKAKYIWLSWDADNMKVRFKRIGQKLT